MIFSRFVVLSSILLLLSGVALAEPSDTGYTVCFEDFMENVSDGKPTILYTAKTTLNLSMRSEPDSDSPAVGQLASRETVRIWGYDQEWLFCWEDSVGIYYIRRRNVDTVEPVGDNTAPYGIIANRYVAIADQDTFLYTEPRVDSDSIVSMPAGTRFTLWFVRDGWAVVPYNRLVGYVYVGHIADLTPISPHEQTAEDGDILAAYTTFFSTKNTELNIGRMENLRVGCRYIQRTYAPGEVFDFNQVAGPYRISRGYMSSPVLIGGGTVAGYGGGTCQVATTLYVALLQIPEGITILFRRPHGSGGSSYAPHGVDSAVGADNINLQFRNDYNFPIYLDCLVQEGVMSILIRKGTMPQ